MMKGMFVGVAMVATMLVLMGTALAKGVPKATGEIWFTEVEDGEVIYIRAEFAVFDHEASGDWGYWYEEAGDAYYWLDFVKVKVMSGEARFAGQVTDTNVGPAMGVWYFIGVHDGGEPGIGMDYVWGQGGSMEEVLGWVDSPYPDPVYMMVEEGNLQVHMK